MAVTDYKNNTCKYKIPKLDNVIYMVDDGGIGLVNIDQGNAYFVQSAASLTKIECYNISLNEDDVLDERYEFTHTLKFSVNGYMNAVGLNGYGHVIVKGMDGVYWLLNPFFPNKITYTYTLAADENHTDFTFSTKSNYPLLRVINFNPNYVKQCKGYTYCGINKLVINETDFSAINNGAVKYTNDGFKDIVYMKDSCQFQEAYDGDNVSHQVKFKVDFDDYKSSWHYNLLEFTMNKYAMVLGTRCGMNVACGFNHGLQPSYKVTGSDSQVNSIEVTLADLHDQGSFIELPTDVPFTYESGTTWNWVYDEWDCVTPETAVRTLKQETDIFGNPTGNYQCLEGYESAYTQYNIVGTFDEEVEFGCDDCRNSECMLETSMPSVITFNSSGSCKHFNVRCTSDFTISGDSAITVTPTSGIANTSYSLQVCNSSTPTSTVSSHTITFKYCDDKTSTFTVNVVEASPSRCLPQGQYYNLGSGSQSVTVPTTCCVSAVTSNNVDADGFQIQDGYVKLWLNSNDTGSERTITITLTMCDGTETEVYLIQDSFYSRWVKEGTECDGTKLCDFERLYSGTSQDDINTATYITRYNNCSASTECESTNTRWIETTYTTCYNGKLYYVEFLQVYRNGEWYNTGQNRIGAETPDVSGQCATNIEHWKVVANDYWCDGTTKYTKERLYIQADIWEEEEDWTPTDSYRKGGTVLEYNSVDCGASGDTYTYQEWRTEGTMCDGTAKYLRLRQYVSNDAETWIATDVYKRGALIDSQATDCGYVERWEYRWVLTDNTTCGED